MTIYYMEGKEYAERTIQIPNSDTNVSDEKVHQICSKLLLKYHAPWGEIRIYDGDNRYNCYYAPGQFKLFKNTECIGVHKRAKFGFRSALDMGK